MKKQYSAPDAEIILFNTNEDILTDPGGDASVVPLPDSVDEEGEF